MLIVCMRTVSYGWTVGESIIVLLASDTLLVITFYSYSVQRETSSPQTLKVAFHCKNSNHMLQHLTRTSLTRQNDQRNLSSRRFKKLTRNPVNENSEPSTAVHVLRISLKNAVYL